MEIETKELDQATVVQLSGDLDGRTAPTAQAQVLPLVQPNSKLILDLSGVGYMSSAGLRMLLSLYRQVVANQGHVVLVGLSDSLRDTMDLTGFLSYFETRESIEDGLVALNAS